MMEINTTLCNYYKARAWLNIRVADKIDIETGTCFNIFNNFGRIFKSDRSVEIN